MLRKCACLSGADLIADASTRRSFLSFFAGVGLSVGFTPVRTWAQKPTYEAMLLSCIDPRIIDPVHNYMNARDLDGRYSQFTIAGAAIAAEAKAFETWHQTFWDNLATSIELHKIKRVIARIAYGVESVADSSSETHTHKRVLAAFRQDVQRRHPHLGVETGLMSLDGKIEMFT
jgi:hypothetical protein